MGSLMSKAMDESFQKNKAFMQETQKLTMERQIQMQNAMREKMMAMQLAGSREMFNWIGSFYTLAAVAMIAGFLKTRKPTPLVPLLPLTFIVGYQWDWCYNNKVERIREMAEKILEEEQGKLILPKGLPTFAQLDARRLGSPSEEAKKD